MPEYSTVAVRVLLVQDNTERPVSTPLELLVDLSLVLVLLLGVVAMGVGHRMKLRQIPLSKYSDSDSDLLLTEAW